MYEIFIQHIIKASSKSANFNFMGISDLVTASLVWQLSMRLAIKKSRVRFRVVVSKWYIVFFVYEILIDRLGVWKMEVFLARFRRHVNSSVLVVMNICGNRYWEISALKYTDTSLTFEFSFHQGPMPVAPWKNWIQVNPVELVADSK